MSRSRHSRTGMSGVVVFGLPSVGFAIQGDITRVEKHQHRRRRVRVTEEYYETALVPDLLPEKAVVQGVPPSGAVGVGDGLKRLVREDIIGRIRKLSVGSRGNREARYAEPRP